MATSKMKIKKVCEWCGTTFYAQKLTTRFCSHRCSNLAYKEAVRQKRIQEVETKVQTVIREQPISDFKDKEYLSFKEAATLLGLSKQAIYKMVYAGKLQAFRISSRLSFIRKGDIDRMLEARPYEQRQSKDTIPITDFYTTAELRDMGRLLCLSCLAFNRYSRNFLHKSTFTSPKVHCPLTKL
jgi:excisionase family DNA binding protein